MLSPTGVGGGKEEGRSGEESGQTGRLLLQVHEQRPTGETLLLGTRNVPKPVRSMFPHL